LILLIPSAALILAFGIGLLPSSVVFASLWLMLSRRGGVAFQAYTATRRRR
jgi:hypothetical protein